MWNALIIEHAIVPWAKFQMPPSPAFPDSTALGRCWRNTKPDRCLILFDDTKYWMLHFFQATNSWCFSCFVHSINEEQSHPNPQANGFLSFNRVQPLTTFKQNFCFSFINIWGGPIRNVASLFGPGRCAMQSSPRNCHCWSLGSWASLGKTWRRSHVSHSFCVLTPFLTAVHWVDTNKPPYKW